MAKGKKRALTEVCMFFVAAGTRVPPPGSLVCCTRGALCCAPAHGLVCVRACVCVCCLSRSLSLYVYVLCHVCVFVCVLSVCVCMYVCVCVLCHALRTQEGAAATSGGEDDAAAPTRPKKQKKTAR